MSGGKWLADLVGEIVTSVRQQVVEKGWSGEVQTPDVAAPELSPAERLGGDRLAIPVQPEYRTNIGFGDFVSGDVSPIAPNPDVGLGVEQGVSHPQQDRGHEMDR